MGKRGDPRTRGCKKGVGRMDGMGVIIGEDGVGGGRNDPRGMVVREIRSPRIKKTKKVRSTG